MISNKCRSHIEKEEAAGGMLRRKLASSGGFTMVELLMAMLLVAMLTSLVGGGVSVVQNAWKKVVIKADAQLALSMAVSQVSAELQAAEPSTIEVAAASASDKSWASFYNVDRGYAMILSHDSLWDAASKAPASGSVKDNLYIHGTGGKALKLLTEESLPSGLVPRITAMAYEPSNRYFTCTVSIVRVESSGEVVYASQDIAVRPVNQ